MDKKFLSAAEAITLFGLDPAQFQRLLKEGEVRALADRGTWKYRRDEIENLIQEGLLSATNPDGLLESGISSADMTTVDFQLDDDVPDEIQKAQPVEPLPDLGKLDLKFPKNKSSKSKETVFGEGIPGFPELPEFENTDSKIQLSAQQSEANQAAQQSEAKQEVTADEWNDATAPTVDYEPADEIIEISEDIPVAESLSEFDIRWKTGDSRHDAATVSLDEEAAVKPTSDSDVRLAEDQAAQSGLNLAGESDSDVALVGIDDSAISLSDSTDSEVRLTSSSAHDVTLVGNEASDEMETLDEEMNQSDSDVRLSASSASDVRIVDLDDSDVRLADTSPESQLMGAAENESHLTEEMIVLPGSESDILVVDSQLMLDGPDSVLLQDASNRSRTTPEPVETGDSQLSFEIPDSGIVLDSSSIKTSAVPGQPDSGLDFDIPDSGIQLDSSVVKTAKVSEMTTADDSAIQLDASDLDVSESGVKLDSSAVKVSELPAGPVAVDSDLAFEIPDSGISLEAPRQLEIEYDEIVDSSVAAVDDGLALDLDDSGIALDVVPDHKVMPDQTLIAESDTDENGVALDLANLQMLQQAEALTETELPVTSHADEGVSQADDSGIVLDVSDSEAIEQGISVDSSAVKAAELPEELDSGITIDVVDSSGLTLASGSVTNEELEITDQPGDSGISLEIPDSGISFDSSVVKTSETAAVSSIDDSDIQFDIPDSGISLEAAGTSAKALPPFDDSGIMLDFDDSGISLEGSGVEFEKSAPRLPDSGITLSEGDSGITLETGDSGITLEGGDSGITLESIADSGISLEVDDSGISLGDFDSGIRVEKPKGPSPRAIEPVKTDLEMDELEFAEIEDDEPGSGSNQTAMIITEEDEDEPAPAKAASKKDKAKGKKQSPGISAAFTSSAEVDDLDIAEDLEAGGLDYDSVDDEAESFADVLDASDEVFADSDSVGLTSGSVSAELALPKSAVVTRQEPPWGMATIAPIAVCALLLAVNALILWEGVATMWSGQSPAITGFLVDALGSLGSN